jgi:adenylate cyclase
MLGAVGAREHLEYRAIGDMVNSAARIQALNKRLGTTVLAAIDAMPDEGVCYRQVGTFQLAGKQNLLEICEPLVFGAPASERMRELVERFTAALRRFRQGQLQVAMEDFEAILRDYPDDGPSRFYVEYIRSSREAADGGFCDSVIRLTQ